jgi:hypothetical protein
MWSGQKRVTPKPGTEIAQCDVSLVFLLLGVEQG